MIRRNENGQPVAVQGVFVDAADGFHEGIPHHVERRAGLARGSCRARGDGRERQKRRKQRFDTMMHSIPD
jgi:hypothetical protein